MPHVGIIGAGVAGLRCASYLLSHNIPVTIMDARDRVGGRMHQVNLPGTQRLVDLGPNWIHGATHNPIMDIAEETQTETYDFDAAINMFDEHGKLIPLALSTELTERMWGIISDAFKLSNEQSSEIPPEKSLYDYFEERVVDMFPEDEQQYELKRKMLLQMCEVWGTFVGGVVERQSLKFFWLEETIEGGLHKHLREMQTMS
jgi:UDP-galactopyranose mutase